MKWSFPLIYKLYFSRQLLYTKVEKMIVVFGIQKLLLYSKEKLLEI